MMFAKKMYLRALSSVVPNAVIGAWILQVQDMSDDPPCDCANRVSIEYLSEGRYRLGNKILFIRVSSLVRDWQPASGSRS